MYCNQDDLRYYILEDYLIAAESYNAGIIDASIKNASNEVYERLQCKYSLNPIPAIIKRIVAVIASYRIISAITTIVKTENSNDNEFLPLQRLYQESIELLDKIASGKVNISNSNNNGILNTDYDNNTVVITKSKEFDLNGY